MKKVNVYSTIILNNEDISACRKMDINTIFNQAEKVMTHSFEKDTSNLIYVMDNIIFTPFGGWTDDNISNVFKQNYAIVHMEVPEDQLYIDTEGNFEDVLEEVNMSWDKFLDIISKKRTSVAEAEKILGTKIIKPNDCFGGLYTIKNPKFVKDVCIIKNPFDEYDFSSSNSEQKDTLIKLASEYHKAFLKFDGCDYNSTLFTNKNEYYKLIDKIVKKYKQAIDDCDVTDLGDIY